jgi:hypothetical protein
LRILKPTAFWPGRSEPESNPDFMATSGLALNRPQSPKIGYLGRIDDRGNFTTFVKKSPAFR